MTVLGALVILSKIRRSGWHVTACDDGDTLALTARPVAGGPFETVAVEKTDPMTMYKAACALAEACGVQVPGVSELARL
jgi:hypothetical protein